MPNLASTLKQEIQRLAKKEVKAQTESTKKAVAKYRQDIAALKKQLREQEKKIAVLESQGKKQIDQQPRVEEASGEGIRFSARSVKAQRKRLGFSAANYAKLVGVSMVTIYNWEQGKSRPRKEQLAALAAVRGIGQSEAMAKLEAIKEE